MMISAKVALSLQIRSHQRVPSGSREFKELTKKDAQIRLSHELEKLLSTAQETRKPVSFFYLLNLRILQIFWIENSCSKVINLLTFCRYLYYLYTYYRHIMHTFFFFYFQYFFITLLH
jgi:hypothetical protein